MGAPLYAETTHKDIIAPRIFFFNRHIPSVDLQNGYVKVTFLTIVDDLYVSVDLHNSIILNHLHDRSESVIHVGQILKLT